jgi:hypothetical protein
MVRVYHVLRQTKIAETFFSVDKNQNCNSTIVDITFVSRNTKIKAEELHNNIVIDRYCSPVTKITHTY